MDSLLAAIMTKTVGSALATAVGSRIYLDEAPDGSALPYVRFFIVASTPADTFTEKVEDTLIQFDIFSSSAGATEITDIYGHLTDLFDNCVLTITGDTHLSMQRQSLSTSVEDITTTGGTVGVKHWAVDYSIMVQN